MTRIVKGTRHKQLVGHVTLLGYLYCSRCRDISESGCLVTGSVPVYDGDQPHSSEP